MSFPISAALLDAIVLSVVAQEPEGTYGYRITQQVTHTLELSESTLYPVLRRLQKFAAPSPVVRVGEFVLDEQAAAISWFGQPLNLTRYEFLLLKTLLHAPGRVFSRQQLMELVWIDAWESLDRTVDTHIKTLRAKLRAVNPEKAPINTHRGMGYSLGRS